MSSVSDIARQNLVSELPGVLSPNPYLETDLFGWFFFGGTGERTTEQFLFKGASAKFTPNGTTSSPDFGIGSGQKSATVEGNVRTASVWIYAPKPVPNVGVQCRFFDDLNATLAVVNGPLTTIFGWTFLSVTATAPALTDGASPIVRMTSTPEVTDIIYLDALRLTGGPVDQHINLSNVDLMRLLLEGTQTLIDEGDETAANHYWRLLKGIGL